MAYILTVNGSNVTSKPAKNTPCPQLVIFVGIGTNFMFIHAAFREWATLQGFSQNNCHLTDGTLKQLIIA